MGPYCTGEPRKELLVLLRAGLTVDRDGVMVGANDAKFSKKRRFGKLEVVDKKSKEAEGRERTDK